MTGLTRRGFTLMTGAAGLMAVSGCASRDRPEGGVRRVVVVGGGFGGATAASAVRRYFPKAEVTLIESSATYQTGPGSNAVVAGLAPSSAIERDFSGLRARGVTTVAGTVTVIDLKSKSVKTAEGLALHYDKLILSPGIDVKWKTIEGYDEAAAAIMPHAWKPGVQTALLRRKLEAMPNGGVVVVAVPGNPYSSPTGPYERASLIAHYLKRFKPRSKLLVLDGKDSFAGERLFKEGWAQLYGDMVEWVPASKGGRVIKVEAQSGTIETDHHRFAAAVANIIPPQTAGAIAHKAGLTDHTGFCPVEAATMRSTRSRDVFVIGDAASAGEMPKTAHAASSQAKIAAAAVAADLGGEQPGPFSAVNATYALVAPDWALSITGLYEAGSGDIALVKSSGGASPVNAGQAYRRREAELAEGWYRSICADSWG